MRLQLSRGGAVAVCLFVAACGSGTTEATVPDATQETSIPDSNGGNGATQVPVGLTVTVAPRSVVLLPGQSQQFSAAVSGATDLGVTWRVREGNAGGMVSGAGLYTAPDRPGIYTVVAESNENPGASGTAKVTVTNRPLRGTFSTLLGGASVDGVRDIEVDAVGNVIVAGATASPGFPTTPGAYATTATGGYVAKLSADGKALVFSAIFPELVDSIAVGQDGAIYLSGVATVDVPATNNAFDKTPNGAQDCFVAKLSADGSKLIFATYLGGSQNELRCRVAVDAQGNALVAGETLSPDFPVTAGALDTAFAGHEDGFVAKLDPSGSALVWATFLGGGASGAEEFLSALAVAADGSPVVAGVSGAADFPTTAHAYETTPNGSSGDVVVAKLAADGSGLLFATFVGGSEAELATALALDSLGNVYVTGATASEDFPAAGAFTAKSAGNDAFAFKLRADGAALIYATYLGGGGNEMGGAIALDPDRNAFVLGEVRLAEGAVREPHFPVTAGALDTTFNGLTEPLGIDGFLVKLDLSGSRLVYGTYLGGSDFDFANALAVDLNGAAYAGGRTNSPDFPVTPGAYDTLFVGGGLQAEGRDAELETRLLSGDAFITKLNPAGNL